MSEKTIKATETACEILDFLTATGPCSLTDVAAAVDTSKSGVFYQLQTLANNGMVIKDDGMYRISIQSLQLGGAARDSYTFFPYAKRNLDHFANDTEETAYVSIEENGRSVYVYEASGVGAGTPHVSLGTITRLHTTAAGKAILAHMPAHQRDQILDEELPANTESTITDQTKLRDELEGIAERGIAFDMGEFKEGVRGVGAAIQDGDEVLGAVSVIGPEERFSGNRLREFLPRRIQEVAHAIEAEHVYAP